MSPPGIDERSASRYRAAEAALWLENGADPQTRWVDVPGHDIRVRVLELGEGPPILFVHGATTAGSAWATLVSRLPSHRCLVLDRPGCGLSEPLPANETGSFSALVDVQVAVLDALGVNTADVVGNSLGGACVLSLADRAPERVRRIVLEGAPAIAGITLPTPLRLLAAGWVGRALVRRRFSARDVRWSLRQWGHEKLLASGWPRGAWLDWALSIANDTDTQRNEALLLQTLASWRDWHRARLLDPARLSGIDQPALWLWGSDEPLATIDQGQTWAATMPHATLEIVEAGHVPWLDGPEFHARRIATFLREDRPQPVRDLRVTRPA